jgi:hypothetical protein
MENKDIQQSSTAGESEIDKALPLQWSCFWWDGHGSRRGESRLKSAWKRTAGCDLKTPA